MLYQRFCIAVAFTAIAPLMLPQLGYAQDSGTRPTQLRGLDVELDSEGGFRGQVVDPSGKPHVNRTVRLLHRGELVASAKSDEAGEFRFSRVRGGVHQLALDQGATVIRCWKTATAPPSAQSSILLVSDGKTIRGQYPIGNLFTNPLVFGAIIAAAIAIPVIINNADDGNSSP